MFRWLRGGRGSIKDKSGQKASRSVSKSTGAFTLDDEALTKKESSKFRYVVASLLDGMFFALPLASGRRAMCVIGEGGTR